MPGTASSSRLRTRATSSRSRRCGTTPRATSAPYARTDPVRSEPNLQTAGGQVSYPWPVRAARLTLAVATLASLATLAVPATAAARVGAVELRLPGGRLLASLDSRSARYPENGAVLKIGSTVDRRQEVVIRDVSLLAGRIRASSVVVPAEGL